MRLPDEKSRAHEKNTVQRTGIGELFPPREKNYTFNRSLLPRKKGWLHVRLVRFHRYAKSDDVLQHGDKRYNSRSSKHQGGKERYEINMDTRFVSCSGTPGVFALFSRIRSTESRKGFDGHIFKTPSYKKRETKQNRFPRLKLPDCSLDAKSTIQKSSRSTGLSGIRARCG
ncbi:uncharacterized protein LOC143153033 [Ptiloglossa arizonensis]|uniref:uncharacterized protein LOC143153033 n=1 Tax=Ptiloglossa arizonensis TaxID=3350558 RepID=UPI003F9FF8A1